MTQVLLVKVYEYLETFMKIFERHEEADHIQQPYLKRIRDVAEL